MNCWRDAGLKSRRIVLNWPGITVTVWLKKKRDGVGYPAVSVAWLAITDPLTETVHQSVVPAPAALPIAICRVAEVCPEGGTTRTTMLGRTAVLLKISDPPDVPLPVLTAQTSVKLIVPQVRL